MSITKKQAAIYNKYGIDVIGDKLISPLGPVNPPLKEGNSKVGKKVYTFSLLPGKDGTCCCNCKGCYAMTGFFNMPSVKASLEIWTRLVNEHLDWVNRVIRAQLEIIGSGEVRIHAAGDFATKNQDAYAAMWHDIAHDFPSFLFWTYTKVTKFETLFDDLPNANIVKSIIPKIGINFGHCDYVINAYYTLKSLGLPVYICRCGIDKNQHCENCGVCATYKYVLFVEHSTSYKAEEDPLFGKLCEIVNNQ